MSAPAPPLAPGVAPSHPHVPFWKSPRRRRRRVLFRAVGFAFTALVVVLLVRYARAIDWPAVGTALARYDATTLALAIGFATLSYLAYGSYDLIGRIYTHHAISRKTTVLVAMVGYALNQNLGSMVGGVAARFRLYTRIGLTKSAIARIIALSVGTNWLGHMTCAGLVFALGMVPLPPDWPLTSHVLRMIGVLLLGVAVAYFLLCAFSVRRSFTVRAHSLILPSWRMAVVQLMLSVANWIAIALMIYVLLEREVPFATVLGVLLMASIAALVTHIPAGLGAIEAVFVALLAPPLSRATVIAALLAYRAVYYLLPLALAVVAYFAIEVGCRRHAPPLVKEDRT